MPNRVWTNSIDDPTQYSNAYVNTVVVDANKMMHLFRIRTDALPGFNLITNRWDVSNILKLRYPTDFVYSQDSDKRLHILHRSQDYALGYTYQLSNGLWYGTKLTIPISSYHTYVSFIGIDNQKQPIFVWTTSPSGESQYSYLERYTPQSGNSILSQTVNLPDGQTFLSFMYANANNPSSNVPLRVTINANGETSEILTVVPEIDFKWKHATIDLSAWAGQTVTLSFETNQIAGELRTAYYIDEVSIGTGYTDIWARSASVNAMPGDQVTMQIHYGNRSMVDAGSSTLTLTLPAGLTLLDANPPADEPGGSTWTMDSIPAYANGVITLNLEVSAEVPMFDALIGDVSITTSDELETANNYGQLLIRVGNYLFLPAICR